MRVLNVSWTFDAETGGGAAERSFQMSLALSRVGIPSTVLTLNLGRTLDPGRLRALGTTDVVALRCLSERFYIPAFSYARLRRLVEEADVVHMMGHFTLLNTIVYLLARRLHKPYVVCATGALPIYGRSKVIKQFYNWLIGASIIRNAGAAIAITETERPALEAAGAESDRVVVIPNGIDPDNYPKSDGEAFRRQHGLGDAPFVLFVGRLAPIKGPDLLLRAFCGLKDDFKVHRLVFAGPDVGMLAELTEIVAAHGLGDRVVFTGYLGGSAKNEALHAADLVVIPSRQEAMSIVVLEAGAAGTPVLVTDQCGCDDIMGGERGLVVPATVDGLQSGMKQLLDDRSRLAVKGETLRRYVLERYAWDSLILKYVAIYTRLTPGVA